MTKNIRRKNTLTLVFRSLSFKHPAALVKGQWRRAKRKTLVARYELSHNLSEPFAFPDYQVERTFKARTDQNWFDSCKRHPGCLVNVRESLSPEVDVWICPVGDSEEPMPLTLQMFDGWNRICASAPADEYAYFRGIVKKGSTLKAPEFLQKIHLNIGRAVALKGEFGFLVPILSVRSHVPIIEEVLNDLKASGESIPAFLRPRVGFKASNDGRTREEKIQSLLKLLNS